MSDSSPQRPVAFVISPIGEPNTIAHREAFLVLHYIIRKALPSDAYTVVRADEESSPDSITEQVVRRIAESDFIVADLTDRNANVFYELAVAHGFGRPVVHLMKDGQQPPFDVSDQRVIFYDLSNPQSVDEATTKLRSAIVHLGMSTDPSRNPVTAYRQFAAIERSSTPLDANEAIADSLSRILDRLMRIERHVGRNDNPTSARASSSLDDDIMQLAPGDVVAHADFGVGSVMGISGAGKKTIAEIMFESVGRKRILISVAPLERIGF